MSIYDLWHSLTKYIQKFSIKETQVLYKTVNLIIMYNIINLLEQNQKFSVAADDGRTPN